MQTARLNTGVLDERIRAALIRLDELIFDHLKGESVWSRRKWGGGHPYEFHVRWNCYDGVFQVTAIEGEFRRVPYRMNFVGLTRGFVEITLMKEALLMKPAISAVFTSDPNYGFGSSSQSDSPYSWAGSAGYRVPLRTQPDTEFFDWPMRWKGECNETWPMTDKVSRRCANFVNELVTTIATSRDFNLSSGEGQA